MSDSRFFQKGFDKQLSHAIEECGEFLAAAGKTQRFGLDSTNPLLPKEQQETNIEWLTRELYDLRDALDRLHTTINVNALCTRSRQKSEGPPEKTVCPHGQPTDAPCGICFHGGPV